MTLNLNPQLVGRLRDEAARHGVEPEGLVRQIVEELMAEPSASSRQQTTLALLSKWSLEDQTTDPVEIERRRRQWEIADYEVRRELLRPSAHAAIVRLNSRPRISNIRKTQQRCTAQAIVILSASEGSRAGE